MVRALFCVGMGCRSMRCASKKVWYSVCDRFLNTCVFRPETRLHVGPRSISFHKNASDKTIVVLITEIPAYSYDLGLYSKVFLHFVSRPVRLPLLSCVFLPPPSASTSPSMPALRQVPNTSSRPVSPFSISSLLFSTLR